MRTLFRCLLGTALLLASAMAVHGQSEEEVVGEFTGRLVFDAMCDHTVVDEADTTCGPAIVQPFSDPRLDAGELAITGVARNIGDTSTLWIGSWFIGDSDAGWVEVASPRLQHRDGAVTQYTSVLVGTGKNAGLSAVSEVTVAGPNFDFDGRIVRGNMSNGATDFAGVIGTGDPDEWNW